MSNDEFSSISFPSCMASLNARTKHISVSNDDFSQKAATQRPEHLQRFTHAPTSISFLILLRSSRPNHSSWICIPQTHRPSKLWQSDSKWVTTDMGAGILLSKNVNLFSLFQQSNLQPTSPWPLQDLYILHESHWQKPRNGKKQEMVY